MSRIQLTDSMLDVLHKMSGGNPGGLTVMLKLYEQNPTVAPKDAFGGLGPLLNLDTLGIYGGKIWVLYKDCFQEDVTNTLAVLRAVQLGFYTQRELAEAIRNCTPIDCQTLRTKVHEFLKAGEF